MDKTALSKVVIQSLSIHLKNNNWRKVKPRESYESLQSVGKEYFIVFFQHRMELVIRVLGRSC